MFNILKEILVIFFKKNSRKFNIFKINLLNLKEKHMINKKRETLKFLPSL
ncbi:hypothetical protein UT300019_09550 [Clostridium sp. CTA-19]